MNLSPLKPALLWLVLLGQIVQQPAPPSARFRYQRALEVPSKGPDAAKEGQVCAVIDADVFAHAAPSLKDLRLYSGATEIPYATTLSEPLQQESEDARILNLRARRGHILFDLEMPRRPYTGLTLDLAAHDYVATAAVSGSAAENGAGATRLGTFTLFDLTSKQLARSTDIPLSESTFPYLHLDLALTPAPGGSASIGSLNAASTVRGAIVPPSREAQSIYTTAERVSSTSHEGTTSVAKFILPARVPVERVAFTLLPGYKGSFSRGVKIEARGIKNEGSGLPETDAEGSGVFGPEDVSGNIFRVHKSEAGHELSAEGLNILVAIGSNMQQPAMVKVMVENGIEPPLPLAAVELQMRQRRICFDSRSGAAPLALYYGDPALDAPVYNDAALSQAASNPRVALLGPELVNPDVVSASPERRSRQQRPVLRWVALLGCVCIFALLVIRSARKRMAHR